MAKRSRIDIIEDILACIVDKGGKIKPTHLMYKSNLSHIQMKLYLSELFQKKLLEERQEESKKKILITKKGRDFLAQLRQMKEFQKTFGI